MQKTDYINDLAAALAKAQAAMKAAPMNANNPFLKNKYAGLGAVIEASRPHLTANGLAVSQLVTTEGDIVTVETVLMHASGQFISSCMSIQADQSKGLSFAQSVGAVITYMRRYAYASAVGIYADEDTDGEPVRTEPTRATVTPERKANPAPAPAHAAKPDMPLEMAEKVANRDGVLYRDLDSEKLSYMITSMTKAITNQTGEEREATEYKLAAARAILASREEVAK